MPRLNGFAFRFKVEPKKSPEGEAFPRSSVGRSSRPGVRKPSGPRLICVLKMKNAKRIYLKRPPSEASENRRGGSTGDRKFWAYVGRGKAAVR